MSFGVRRIVTGHDSAGNPEFTSDGEPPGTVVVPRAGIGFAGLWQIDQAPRDPSDGGEPTGGASLHRPPGSVWWNHLSFEPTGDYITTGDPELFDPERPGMHATETIDLMEVVSGRILLELDDSETELTAGDCVVQGGTNHRWKVLGDEPCVYTVVMLGIDPDAAGDHHALTPRRSSAPTGLGPRRVVTANVDGRSVIAADGEPPNVFAVEGYDLGFVDVWQSGGPIASVGQGGDAVPDTFQLDPLGMGVSWKHVILPPAGAVPADPDGLAADMARRASGMATTGHHDPDNPGSHRTDTIDLGRIIDGEVWLEVPGHEPRRMVAGDYVVQRGNWHTWHNRSDRPARMSSVLIGAPHGGTR